MSLESVIDVNHLTFAYEERMILQEALFSVQKGEFIGVIGPNGGGKTTLLKLLMGFLKPLKGSVTLLAQSPKIARKHVAWVPQNMRFDRQFPISLLDLVLGGRLAFSSWYGGFHKEDKEIALDAIEKVGLSSFKKEAFSNLSGGQIQRGLIARAIASKPKILLLDEPTANVDVHAENQIYKILSELKREMTILMVTHDLKAVVNQVDRVLCVQGSTTMLKPEQVCGHFALNLYHTPFTG